MTTGSVLILGGRSDIGLAIAHRYAAAGHAVQLAARNSDTLEAQRADIAVRYNVAASVHELDVVQTDSFEAFIASLPELPQIAVSVVGLLGDQTQSQNDPLAAQSVMRANYEGPALMTGLLANLFEQRGCGTIIGISSVAGDRGRASNYIYGSAKAGYTAFLAGLRNRLASKGVHVLTVLPGFVATRMTENMDLPAKLTASPQQVAEAVYKAANKKKNKIYTKPIWWLIMNIIRHIPEFIFKRLKL